MIGKHAYLIMAHNQPEHLRKLLDVLDNERNDIFIHLDKKSSIDPQSLSDICQKSKMYFTNRLNVYWGGTQIEAELILLEAAVSKGQYQYYHLLTGVDFPLKKQSEILRFFDEHYGENFISINEVKNTKYLARVKYYYPLQDHKQNLLIKICRKVLIICQRMFSVDRTKRYSQIKKWAIGSAYFDITDDVARYLVGKKNEIKSVFGSTFCADEMFLQTLVLNSEMYRNLKLYKSSKNNPYIQNTYMDVLRAIDWTRGKPYVWKKGDYGILIGSNCLFARKFDFTNNPEIVEMLYEKIKE